MTLDESYAKSRVESLREQIAGPPEKRVDDLTDEDRDILIEFDKQLVRDRKKNNRCGWYHHKNVLHHTFVFAVETGCLAQVLEDGEPGRTALDQITDVIFEDEGETSGYTIQAQLSSIRVFADTVGDEMPEHIKDIKPGKHVDRNPAPLKSEIVEYEDAIAMTKECDMVRDQALILTEWDGGLRPMAELYTLQFKHLDFGEDHVVISLANSNGKTDETGIILVASAPVLRKWVFEEHPVHDDPEASLNPETYIWTHDNKNEILGYAALAERFRVMGDRAGLTCDYSVQGVRRSCASILARQPYIGERDLYMRFNWSRGSDAPEHYIAQHGTATQKNVAKCRGRKVKGLEEDKDTCSIPCDFCGEWTVRGLDECIWCSHNIDDEQKNITHTTRDPRKTGKKSLSDMILDGDVTADELQVLQKLETAVKTEADLFNDLDQLIERAEALERGRDGADDTSVNAVTGPSTALAYGSSAVAGVMKRVGQAKHAAMKLHPGLEHYPPTGSRLVGLVAGMIGIVMMALVTLAMTGALDAVLSGNPWAIAGQAIGSVLGIGYVLREMPSVDDAIAELRKPQ